jgi:hypothetical protein
MLFGAKAASLANEGKFEKAIICLQSESEPEIGGSVICNIERTTGIVIISKYEDIETIPLFQQIVGLGRNITVDDLVAYHFKLKSENPFARTWGFDYQIRNMTDMQVNLTDATTNQTITTTIPAKFVEYTHSDNTHQQLGKAPDLTHMLFAVYDDPRTGEVTGYDIEFKTAKYNASNFPVPGMFMQQFFLAGELKKIFTSFAIVKASTGTTTTELTTSTEDSTNGDEGSEDAAISTTTQEEGEDGGDTECDSSYPDDCIPSPPPDLDCGDDGVPENFQVAGSDPHGFDGNDNDGIGCETGSNQPEAGGGDEGDEEDGGDGGGGADNDGEGGGDDDGGNGGDEGEGGGEGNDPNEFEGCIVPPGRDPGDAGC